MNGTPRENGFYFPAEWDLHEATWLSWPVNQDTWPKLAQMLPDYAAFVAEISRGEDVHINLPEGPNRIQAIKLLESAQAQMDRIVFHNKMSNDAWCRDHGPSILVKDQSAERMVVDWTYNSWGGKYPPYDADNAVPQYVAQHLNLPFVSPNIVLEGGSVDFNGKGTVITTKQCLLNTNRNPHLSQEQIEQYLVDYFGVQNVLWLGSGVVGDDTDGHVDDITRFVNENTVVTVLEHNAKDENYAALRANREQLNDFKLQDGTALNVIELPMPAPLIVDGERLPASYGNFYISNASVIVPIFADPLDDLALDLLAKAFPNRNVIGLDSRKIVWGLGSFHCLSQQIAAPKL